jgi:hypothetical protein
VFGGLPNFKVSYVWNAAPLTKKQKFQLAWRSAIDPGAFAGAALGAGLEQWRNNYRGYGQGAQGYFKRFGASYGDGFDSSMISGALLPSLLHQDPRYFYKGTGSIRSRALYALPRSLSAGATTGVRSPTTPISSETSPPGQSPTVTTPSSRGVRLTFVNATINTAANSVGALIQEFLLKKVTTGAEQ